MLQLLIFRAGNKMDTHDQMFYVAMAAFITAYGMIIKSAVDSFLRKGDKRMDRINQEKDKIHKEYEHFLTKMYDILYFKSTLIDVFPNEKSDLINDLNRSCLKSLYFMSPTVLGEVMKFCSQPNICNYISTVNLMRTRIKGEKDKGISKEMTRLMNKHIK